MPRERVTNNRERRARKVREEVVVRGDTASITTDLLRQDDLPDHLQPMKEHYEITITADEVQKRTRIKAQETLGVINTVSKEVLTTVSDHTTDAVNYLNAQLMRQTQREKFIDAIDEVDDLTIEAIQDGIEESGHIINTISDTDPRTRRKAKVVRERKLNATERLTGRILEET